MGDLAESKARKQHDLEETPRERGRRIVRTKLVGKTGDAGLRGSWDRLDDAIHQHARRLSPKAQREIIAYLERRFETTRTLIEGIGESPEFFFSEDLDDMVEGL